MSNISRLTTLAAAGAAVETEQYVAITCTGTVSDLRNSLIVIPFNKNDGFGTYQNIPAGSTAPPNRPSTYGRVDWSASGGAILFTHFDAPLVSAYAFSGGSIGSKYSNPASVMPGSSASGIAFNSAGNRFAVGSNSTGSGGANSFAVYQWSDATGFGSRTTSNFTGGQEPWGLSWSPTDGWIGVATQAPDVKAIVWTGSAFGTVDTNPFSTLTQIYNISWNNAGDHVAVAGYDASVNTKRLLIAQWSNSTGFGTVVSPAWTASNQILDAKWSHDDAAIVCAVNSSPYVKAFAWDNSTSTLGSELPNTASAASARGNVIDFNTAGDVVFVGVNNSKLINAYKFNSTTGFGSKYADPVLTGFPTSGPVTAGIAYKDFG